MREGIEIQTDRQMTRTVFAKKKGEEDDSEIFAVRLSDSLLNCRNITTNIAVSLAQQNVYYYFDVRNLTPSNRNKPEGPQ